MDIDPDELAAEVEAARIERLALFAECLADFDWEPHETEDTVIRKHADMELDWIARNQTHPAMPETAGEWLRGQIEQGAADPAGRLSRALSRKRRQESKEGKVLYAIAAFIRKEKRLPERAEIVIEGVSGRTRDAAFQIFCERFGLTIDAREKWERGVYPQSS